jgi:pimeloyl-ACP methyl ester carboxylesterase
VVSTLRDPIEPALVREFQVSTLAREIPEEWLGTVVSESLKVPARVWQALFAGFLETPDFSSELAKVAAPTLIVWGDRDSYALQNDQDVLRSTIPHARLLTYDGGGHGFHWETPERFALDLTAFVYEPHRAEVASADASTQAPVQSDLP